MIFLLQRIGYTRWAKRSWNSNITETIHSRGKMFEINATGLSKLILVVEIISNFSNFYLIIQKNTMYLFFFWYIISTTVLNAHSKTLELHYFMFLFTSWLWEIQFKSKTAFGPKLFIRKSSMQEIFFVSLPIHNFLSTPVDIPCIKYTVNVIRAFEEIPISIFFQFIEFPGRTVRISTLISIELQKDKTILKQMDSYHIILI